MGLGGQDGSYNAFDGADVLGMRLACAAYSVEPVFKTFPPVEVVKKIRVRTITLCNDTEVFVGRLSTGAEVPSEWRGQAFVAFRGTEPLSIYDWLLDASLLPSGPVKWWEEAGHKVQAHSGFQLAFNSCKDEIAEALSQMFQGGHPQRLLVCGHSLGGGLATLAGVWAVVGDTRPFKQVQVRLVTAGAPRVAGKDFAREFKGLDNISTTRIVHNLDIVPGIPFNFMGGYCHIDARVVFLEKVFLYRRLMYKVNFHERPTSYRWVHVPMCAVGLLLLFVPALTIFFLQTTVHSMRYLFCEGLSKKLGMSVLVNTGLGALLALVLGTLASSPLPMPPFWFLLLTFMATCVPLMDHFEWKYSTAVDIVANGGIMPKGLRLARWRYIIGTYLQNIF